MHDLFTMPKRPLWERVLVAVATFAWRTFLVLALLMYILIFLSYLIGPA